MDSSFRNRALVVSIVMVVGLTALSYKLLFLQVLAPEVSETPSITRLRVTETIPASRGLIVDRNRTVIAQNRPEATLVADRIHYETLTIIKSAVVHRYVTQMAGWDEMSEKKRLKLREETRARVVDRMDGEQLIAEHLDYAVETVSRELRIPRADLKKKLEGSQNRIVLETGIREDLARRIERELRERMIQGFRFERSIRRVYPMPSLAPHLVGFRNYEEVSQLGIEKSMDHLLSGRDGERVLKRDENGMVYLTEAAEVRPPMMGKDVKITLDMGLQEIAEEELGKAMETYRAEKGCLLLVDPHSGDVWAMASHPDFDLNVRERYTKASQSFAISAMYEAGSVIKLVAAAASLELGRVNRQTIFDCGWGQLNRPGFTLRDHHPYGDLTFDQIMAKSSNLGIFQIAERIGRENFENYLRAFGFAQRTGFELPGEARGNLVDLGNQRNFAGATYGYGVSVTPLQIAMAYSAIANGGTLMKPRLVDSVSAKSGIELQKNPIEKVRRVVSGETARQMRLVLEEVVKNGTGHLAAVPGYRVAGKTGTAHKWDNENEEYDQLRAYVTFVGMLPVDDPKFVCVVTIDEPKEQSADFTLGGGTVAAPIFAQAAGRFARYLNLEPTEEIPDEPESQTSLVVESQQ